MAVKTANAAQKQWMSDISDACQYGILGALYGEEYEECNNYQLHHVKGRSFKHNKVAIGHWFILPVPFELHDPNMNHEFHVGKCKKAFVKRFGTQRDLFDTMYHNMHSEGYKVPSNDVYNAIMETSA